MNDAKADGRAPQRRWGASFGLSDANTAGLAIGVALVVLLGGLIIWLGAPIGPLVERDGVILEPGLFDGRGPLAGYWVSVDGRRAGVRTPGLICNPGDHLRLLRRETRLRTDYELATAACIRPATAMR